MVFVEPLVIGTRENMNLISSTRFFYFLAIMICFLLYPVLNQERQITYVLKLPIDTWIPFLPVFSIFYLLYGPFLLVTLVYFLFFSKNFNHAGFSFIFCLIMAFLFYIFFQTYIARPDVVETDIFSKIVSFIYANDRPYNCFPSLHVSLSILSFLHWLRSFPQVKVIMGIFTLLIILSTVLIKQHYMPDVIGGIILSIASFYLGQIFQHRIKILY
jgi:membrane-associated phospholipid phosphatase